MSEHNDGGQGRGSGGHGGGRGRSSGGAYRPTSNSGGSPRGYRSREGRTDGGGYRPERRGEGERGDFQPGGYQGREGQRGGYQGREGQRGGAEGRGGYRRGEGERGDSPRGGYQGREGQRGGAEGRGGYRGGEGRGGSGFGREGEKGEYRGRREDAQRGGFRREGQAGERGGFQRPEQRDDRRFDRGTSAGRPERGRPERGRPERRGTDSGTGFGGEDRRRGGRGFEPRGERGFEPRGERGERTFDRRGERGERSDRAERGYSGDRGTERRPYQGRPQDGRQHRGQERHGKPYRGRPGEEPASESIETAAPQHGSAADLRSANRPERPRSPEIDEDVTGSELDRATRAQLKTLESRSAEWVAKHLVMAGRLLDEEPELAFQHALAASRRGGRMAAVREAVGVTAYAAGHYGEALREFRTFRRISGSNEHLPIMADCERGLGRPDRALDMVRSEDAAELDTAGQVELAMVASGARADLEEYEAAVTALEIPQLDRNRAFSFSPRLFRAYADALERVGRADEAGQWRRQALVAEKALGVGAFEEPEIIDLVGDDEEPRKPRSSAPQGGAPQGGGEGAAEAPDEPGGDAAVKAPEEQKKTAEQEETAESEPEPSGLDSAGLDSAGPDSAADTGRTDD
jgi:tetratricopeptide (TPR) repeat protein